MNKEYLFIQEHKSKKLPEIALLLSKHPELDKEFIIGQINGLQKAKNKLPEFYNKKGIVFPSKLSFEQCSSEETAIYKSNLVSGKNLVDLTGGFGIDSYYFSKQFNQVTYVEPNTDLFDIVKSNFQSLEVNNITPINSTAEAFLKSNTDQFSVTYIDPSRRNENERVFRLENCVPNIIELAPEILNIADKLLIKTAPLLDIKQTIKDLKNVEQVVVVSVDNDCKEVLYLMGKEQNQNPEIISVNLTKIHQEMRFNYELEANVIVSFSEPQKYLYEPNSSILKAGGFNTITQKFKVNKLHPNTHLYTSEKLIKDFPGRNFLIEQIIPYQPKSFKKLGIKKANVASRNFSDSVEQVKNKLGLKDGGDVFVFAFTDFNEKKLVSICRKAT